MVAISDFCWSAFLTKSALFLKFAPPGKKTPAPLVVAIIVIKEECSVEVRLSLKLQILANKTGRM